MLNKVILIGNLGAEPEIRAMNSTARVATLSLATSESWLDKNTRERVTKTEWHRITVFNEYTISFIENYVKKGAKLYVEGALQTNKYTDSAGVEKYTTQIIISQVKGQLILLDKRDAVPDTSFNDNFTNNSNNTNNSTSQNNFPAGNIGADLDDEIPF